MSSRDIEEIERALGIRDVLEQESNPLRIHLDSRRYGKNVTVIDGFSPTQDIRAVAGELKRFVGAGGTAKDGRIELQGDHRRAVTEWLRERGYPLG